MQSFVVALVVASTLHSVAAAQGLASPRSRPESIATALTRLRPSSFVRLSIAGHRVEGHYSRIDQDTLHLAALLGPQTVLVGAIDSLWVRRRATLRGALIGGGILAASGAVLGYAGCGFP